MHTSATKATHAQSKSGRISFKHAFVWLLNFTCSERIVVYIKSKKISGAEEKQVKATKKS